MLLYILKSVACMAIFFVFYKVFLEKESVHVFKRFYLLLAVGAALLIPAIVFTDYVVVEPVPYIETPQTVVTDYDYIGIPSAFEKDVLDIEPVLWTIYFLGFTFFGLRFIQNLRQVIGRIRKNPKQKSSNFIQVLLQESFPPHTFFQYIFLNKKELESNAIPKEVLLHEETHARQRHSLDVVSIELLQLIFWFNPFVYVFKKAIKLNHEFLADQAVLKKNINPTTYQNTLLSYLSPDSEKKYQPSLANAINYSSYSSIKKRFTIMKKSTSRKSVFIKSLLLVPLLALLLYGFSETKIETIMITPPSEMTSEKGSLSESALERTVELAGLILDSETLLPLNNVEVYDAYGTMLSKTDERGYYKISMNNLGTGEMRFRFSLRKKGYETLAQEEHWGNLTGAIKSTFYFGLQPKDSGSFEFSELLPDNKNLSYASILQSYGSIKSRIEFNKKMNAAKIGNQHILIAIDHSYYLVNDTGWIRINSKDAIISVNDNQFIPAHEVNNLLKRKDITGMTPLAQGKARYAIYTFPEGIPAIQKEAASDKDIRQYNVLAKKYNKQPKAIRSIPLKDLEVLEAIFRKMTDTQRNDAEPFPECDVQKHQEGATKKQIKEYNALAKKYNRQLSEEKNIRIYKPEVERLVYLYALMTQEQKENAEPFPDFPEPPPSPEAPNAPKVSKREQGVIPPPPSNAPKAPKVKDREQSAIPQPPKTSKPTSTPDKSEEEFAGEAVAEIIANQDPYDFVTVPVATSYFSNSDLNFSGSEAIQNNSAMQKINKRQQSIEHHYIPKPSNPPVPKSPLDHVIEMAKKGAVFYYEGNKISSDEAIAILKKNKSINIDTRGSNGNRPVMKLSTAPITID